MDLRIAGIVNDSIVDGPGLRLTVFTQGCINNCKGCHNPDTRNLDGGKIVSTDYILQEFFKNPLLDGITFSGGEPLLQVSPLSIIAKEIKKNNFNVVVYTGYIWENIIKDIDKYIDLLQYTDIIIDGPFIEELKSYNLNFKGSKNQRIIDVDKSLTQNKIILYKFKDGICYEE